MSSGRSFFIDKGGINYMIETMKKTFLNRYHYFFDANGNLNPHCNEEERKKFLKLCSELEPKVSFGDEKTGEIYTREVLTLRKEVLEEMLPVVYDEVFDEHGNVKACGREKCLELIEICAELDPFNYYGDSKQGFLDEENIKKLRGRMNS